MTVADAVYAGDEKLVFAIDLGTTMSAVSFCHLQPGLVPKVRLVTKWPGQEDAAGDCKIPTVVRYVKGEPVAFGADALENAHALDDSALARWFKLHLHPAAMRRASNLAEIPPLPKGVSLKQVYAHFAAYVFEHASSFFRDNSHDGRMLWDRLKGAFDIVLAIPNGWDVVQQGFLRDAVVLAGILPQNHDAKRLTFVSEAEASVHYGLDYSDGERWLQVGTIFAVLDAGGSTVDTTLYRCTGLQPKLQLEEVTSSECVQAGSVFVDREAEKMLSLKLKGSKFGNAENIAEMMTIFEKKTKRKFDGGPEASVIHFGRAKDNDPSRNISKGRITLTSEEVAIAFQNPLIDIIASTERVITRSEKVCEALLMVGGFAESPFLRKTLRDKFESRGMQIISIDDGTKKAAAEGAAIWYIRQSVVARCARAYFGTNMFALYDGASFHSERAASKFTQPDGRVEIGPIFDVWCAKNDKVRWEQAKTFRYWRTYGSKPAGATLGQFELAIYACDGDARPRWLYDAAGSRTTSAGVRYVCKVAGDMRGLAGELREMTNPEGKKYWKVEYAIEMFFGQTALCAQLVWNENGVQKKGPLTLVPNSVQ